MKTLNLNDLGVQEMNAMEMVNVEGGGKFEWKEAAVAYLLLGVPGVGIYWYFCD